MRIMRDGSSGNFWHIFGASKGSVKIGLLGDTSYLDFNLSDYTNEAKSWWHPQIEAKSWCSASNWAKYLRKYH
jgi:hypothetical protein